MTEPVLFEIDQHIALITLNRPEVRNAINPAVTNALNHLMGEIERDERVWVTVLTGAGDVAFSSGADLKSVVAGDVDKLWAEPGGFAGFVQFPRLKPVIAAVNGLALAGGCELVLASDLVVAAETARFGLPEVTRGIVAAAGGVFRLPARIPLARAIEMIITGDSITALEALQLGLINKVVASADVMPAARSMALRICENGPIAVRESLAIARHAHELTETAAWAACLAARRRALASDDGREGPRAFVEKRKPVWTGR